MGGGSVSLRTVQAFLDHLEARDQSLKLIQYASRMFMWYLLEADPKSDLGIRLRNLYKGTSTSRKAFRLAKSLNQYHKLKDALIRETGSFSRLAASVVGFGGMTGYYFFDNLIWLSKLKVIRVPDKTWSYYAARLWFFGCAALALLYTYDLQANQELERAAIAEGEHARDEEGRRELEARVARIRTKRTDLLLNVLKYCANAGVAANQSGYLKMTTGMQLHDGAVGALGAVAALCSLQKVARTVAKEHRAKQA